MKPLIKIFSVVLSLLFFSLVLSPRLSANSVQADCKEARPEAPPILVTAEPADKSVKLAWIEAKDPVTYYLLRYGKSKENFEYGIANIGGKGTNSFTVGELENGVKYYFQVRAGNGCKPGKFSNTLTAMAGTPEASEQLANAKRPKNLSIYKTVLGASIAVQQEVKAEITPVIHKTSPTQLANYCAFNCFSWPLLVGEIAMLFVFFYFARKQSIIKPIFSILIPIFLYIVFYKIHGGCNSYKFLCRYFLPLSAMIYLVIFLTYKHHFIKSRTKTT